MEDKRFIEVSFPVKEVSIESAREKNIRHGHISTLHIWWARRPLASSRVTNYAALAPAPKDDIEWEKTKRFIIELSKWENSLNPIYIEKAKKDILSLNGGTPPRVLDPFAGGGAIPLEALRLGCETYASDYNPVAVLILKCTLEYPQRYGRGSGFGVGSSGFTKIGGSEHEKLQGTGSMAESNQFGNRDIQNNPNFSARREILSDISNTTGSHINSSQHSRGMGQRFDEGIYSVSADSQGIINGTGDPFYNSYETQLSRTRDFEKAPNKDREHRDDAQPPNSKIKETLNLFPNPEPRTPNPESRIPNPEPRIPNPLLHDVKKWGNYVLEDAKKEIGRFYPIEKDGSIPVGYIWARTIPCQNPSCRAEIPLMRQYWLARKDKKKVALYPYVIATGAKQSQSFLHFKIVGDGYENMPKDFNPEKGTISRAVATCLVCGGVVDDNTTRRLFQGGKAGQRMVSVVLHKKGTNSKRYRIATSEDVRVFEEAEMYLEPKRQRLMEGWGFDPVPDENIEPNSVKPRTMWLYGMTKWGDLFNSRQKLALITFVEKVRQAHKKMLAEGEDEEYAKAVVSYLALGINRLADKNSVLCRLISQTEAIGFTYGRQALPMLWDYIEMNPVEHPSGWIVIADEMLSNIKHCSYFQNTTTITQSSATYLPYPDNYFDAVFTDPPYYDNVNYAELSDFFYVWLKRTVGDLYPELFSTPLVPKAKEIVANPVRHGDANKAREFFEGNISKAFKEIYRVLKQDGITTIVYAHKSTSGWESLINSLLNSGLVITASYPIHTEMKARLTAKETASLASSIYIVARKMKRQGTGWFNNVKEEIKAHIYKKLERLWNEGISGGDFFIAGIGSAIEIFGKYEKVMDFEGNIIRADKLLEYVREIVTDYAVRQILHNGIAGELSHLTRFYLLYRWTYQEAKVHFDDARKLAQSTGVDLEREWNKGFIRKEKEFIKCIGPQDRELEEFDEPEELIDVLHLVLLLWAKGNREEMKKVLALSGFGVKDAFYRVAQAVSETLPNENKEKKLLDGFLTGRDKIVSEVKDVIEQMKLF